MSSNLRNLMPPNHHIDDYNHSNNKIMHNNHTTLHPSNTSSISTTTTKKEAKNKSPSPAALSALPPMSPMSALSATAPFPIPAAVTYRSQLNPKNRKRVRAINDNYSSLSPNINNSLKRQRRKLDSQIQLNNKRNSNIENVEDLDLSETDYTDDDYVPPLKSISIKSAKSTTVHSHSHSNSNSNSDVVGYRKLNWRKQQVATPKFVLIDKNDKNEIMSELSASAPPKLRASASTMEMYGVLGDKLEDTSNEAYFYRHYRAEAREKFFYEELFESRLKQQQILEEKEKRRKKKQKRTRKKSKKNKPKLDMENNGNNVNDMNSDDCDYDDDDDDDGLDVDGNDDDDNDGEEDCMPMDLALPKLPTGPWSYKLGAKYDKRPQVPKNVKNRPTFNYNIPFEKLQRKQFITDLEEKKKLDNWWEMPPNLIRRTDYGNMANIKVKINPNTINVANKNKNDNGDLKKKQELIELYQQLKQKMKKSEDKKKKHRHKHKHKKKDKYHKKNKDKHKNKNKDKHKNCPVDVRLLLKK